MPVAKMSEQREDYNARMYETFNTFGTKPAEWKWDGQDPKENRGFGGVPAGACQLCGKHPIAYEYTIIHMGEAKPISGNGFVGVEWVAGTSKNLKLIVGSECVANYVEAAPYSQRRKAADAMKRLTMLNKMTNFLVEKNLGKTYEEARKQADDMQTFQIQRFFAGQQKARNDKRLKARADALDQFIGENRNTLWDQNWSYFGPKTILSSLGYMVMTWRQGRETPYMEGPMNYALAKFGLSLPAKPKLKDLEEQ